MRFDLCYLVETELVEYPIDEDKALKNLSVVTMAKREVDIVRYWPVFLPFFVFFLCSETK